MQDTEEEIRWADMFKAFEPTMDQLRDADSALYAKPMSMVQIYDLVYASAPDIGRLPDQSLHEDIQ